MDHTVLMAERIRTPSRYESVLGSVPLSCGAAGNRIGIGIFSQEGLAGLKWGVNFVLKLPASI